MYRDILIDQAAEQFGIKDIVALAAGIDGLGLVPKRFQMKGASKGTSLASKFGSKLLPQKLPRRVFSGVRNGRAVFTKTLGRLIGRSLGPIGWGLLAYDISKTLYNTQIIYNEITTLSVHEN